MSWQLSSPQWGEILSVEIHIYSYTIFLFFHEIIYKSIYLENISSKRRYIKLSYSEQTTKIWKKSSTLFWRLLSNFKSTKI